MTTLTKAAVGRMLTHAEKTINQVWHAPCWNSRERKLLTDIGNLLRDFQRMNNASGRWER